MSFPAGAGRRRRPRDAFRQYWVTMTATTVTSHDSQSFTLSRNREADELVRCVLAELRDEGGRLAGEFGLVAIILGGGYGRGEGGAVVTPGQPVSLYNDMDFFAFTRNTSRRQRRRLDERLRTLADGWSRRLGIDIDFAPAREVSRLASQPVTLMYQELLRGHCVAYASEPVLAAVPWTAAAELPMLEGLRLHMNRGTGLLRASRMLAANQPLSREERDFVWRNLHKCALGCGDALLIAARKYEYELPDRCRLLPAVAADLGDPAAAEELCACYAAAAAFKKHPSREVVGDAAALAGRLRPLWRLVLAAGLDWRAPARRGRGLLAQLASRELRGGVWWKNYLLNLAYGWAKGYGVGCAMPPQYWLLIRLDGLLACDVAAPQDVDRLLTLWRRFN